MSAPEPVTALLTSAIVALTTALGVLWRRLRQRETEITKLHAQRVADFRALLSKRTGVQWPRKPTDSD